MKKISSLENLCGPNKPLHHEPPDELELLGLLRSGDARLKDAAKAQLALESQFDLAYNAAHSHQYPNESQDLLRILQRIWFLRNQNHSHDWLA